MNSFSLKNALIYDSDAEDFISGGIAVEDGVITEIGALSPQALKCARDVHGRRIIPAMVDVHSHGRDGIDFCGASERELLRLKAAYAAVGTATVVPTLASATQEEWRSSVKNVKNCGFDAIHFEGRYLAPEKRGAHAPELLSLPKSAEMKELLELAGDMHVHVSFAPELKGGIEFIKFLAENNASAGLAHTSATYEEAMAAVEAGAISFTHTFNAMTEMLHRKPGTVGAALSSGRYAEFICDGVHVHPAVIKAAYNAVPHDKFVLITDSLMAAGCGDGEYTLAGLRVNVSCGIARTEDGAIAGSMLDLFTAMRNLMNFTGISLEKALPCATSNPAKMLSLDKITGSLRVGLRADIIILDEYGTDISSVYSAGNLID